MQVFLIGGLTGIPGEQESIRLTEYANRLGGALARKGHTILVCSPFQGTLDRAALEGAGADGTRATVEFHHLNMPQVSAEIALLRTRFGNLKVSQFQYPAPTMGDLTTLEGREALSMAWLLPQIRAMDRSSLTIALGGKPDGAASMLLHLASARKRALLPLPFLGGAAEHAFGRHKNELADQWGADFEQLENPAHLEDVVSRAETLFMERHERALQGERSNSKPLAFFISYPRARPAEADFVESLLRRHLQPENRILRDEHEFAAGQEIPAQIREQIFEADVFISIWCRDYACSPWCTDELEVALERLGKGLSLWIFLVDETRMVPRAARSLLHLVGRTREEIEAKLLGQLGKLLNART